MRKKERKDWTKLSQAVQKGKGNVEFLKDIEQAMSNSAQDLQECRNQNYVDDHWATLLHVIQPIAQHHFAKPPSKQSAQYLADTQQRLDVLQRRACLREQLAEPQISSSESPC